MTGQIQNSVNDRQKFSPDDNLDDYKAIFWSSQVKKDCYDNIR